MSDGGVGAGTLGELGMQDEFGGSRRDVATAGAREEGTGDVDMSSLLESLSFPWSLHSDTSLSDDDFASLLLDPMYSIPNARGAVA